MGRAHVCVRLKHCTCHAHVYGLVGLYRESKGGGSGFSRNTEPNRSKPCELGRFFPARHWAKSKIAPLGQTARAPAAHLLAQSGYFRSAWFSLWATTPVRKISPDSPGAPLRGAAAAGRGAHFLLVPGAAAPPPPPPIWGRAVTSAAGLRVGGWAKVAKVACVALVRELGPGAPTPGKTNKN